MEKYRLRPGVVLTQICGQYLLVVTQPVRNQVHSNWKTAVNETGGRILSFLEKEALTLPDIITRLSEEYEVDNEEEMIQDVNQFVFHLQSNGYVTKVNQGK